MAPPAHREARVQLAERPAFRSSAGVAQAAAGRLIPGTYRKRQLAAGCILRRVIIRDARPDEYAAVGELRVAAYRELGLLPEGSGYAETLRGLGFEGDAVVLVAAGEAESTILGTITLDLFGPASELARDETEADVRAFAVAPRAQGQGVGRKLLLAVIDSAEKRGVRRLRLCTLPAMKAAQHLYTTTGFSRTPDLDFEPVPGVALRAYELALPLSPPPGTGV
jgi:ribosomal protein S18 acetylase RimI-like enzyme